MALTAMGIKVAINGSETDVDVENDSASWTTKIGNVTITHGGGSWTRPANPAVCQFELRVPVRYAANVRTVTIAMTVIPAAGNGTTITPDDYDPIVGTGAGAYRIVFHGDVQSIRGFAANRDEDHPEPIQFDAVSEMSALLNRRARCAAATDSGIRNMLTDIETAHGLTMVGDDWFPTIADGFPNCDRPAQKRTTNGEYIATMLAGTGMNMVEDWTGTITAPELRWRADHLDNRYYTNAPTDNQNWGWEIGYPWKLTYDDVGVAYGDYVARITVNGEDSAGNQYYGWARLNNTNGVRDALGNRETALTSYIDNAADCKTLARRLIAYQGSPGYSIRMNAVTLNTEVYYKTLVDEGAALPAAGPDPDMEIMILSMMMPGDRLFARGHQNTDVAGSDDFGDGNSEYGDWPTEHPDGSDLAVCLLSLWVPWIGEIDLDAGTAYQLADTHTIRQVRRTFTPTGGWDITYGLLPWTSDIDGTDVLAGDTDSGTD